MNLTLFVICFLGNLIALGLAQQFIPPSSGSHRATSKAGRGRPRAASSYQNCDCQSEAWFPIDLCFHNTFASKTLAHDPALKHLKAI